MNGAIGKLILPAATIIILHLFDIFSLFLNFNFFYIVCMFFYVLPFRFFMALNRHYLVDCFWFSLELFFLFILRFLIGGILTVFYLS